MQSSPSQPQLTGLPWYEPETFEGVCALMHDKDRLFGTYASWLAAAQRTEQHLRGQGVPTIRVTLDLVQFPAWCATHRPGLHIDAEARTQYAAFAAAQMYRAGETKTMH